MSVKKYKICSFVDGNNNKWFQIKIKKSWWPSYWHSKETYVNYDIPVYLRDAERFDSAILAQQEIEELIKKEKSSSIKMLGEIDLN